MESTKAKIGIVGAWVFMVALIIILRFLLIGADFGLLLVAGFVCYVIGLVSILYSSMVARRAKKPVLLSTAWRGMAVTHVVISLLILAFVLVTCGMAGG